MRMYPRSEFPVEVMPPIIRPSGTINRAAIGYRFSAVGCPHGKVDVTVAAIKAGVDIDVAFKLGILAYEANDNSVENIERLANAMMHSAKRRHAEQHPRGVWATAVEALGPRAYSLRCRDPEVQAVWDAACRAAQYGETIEPTHPLNPDRTGEGVQP